MSRPGASFFSLLRLPVLVFVCLWLAACGADVPFDKLVVAVVGNGVPSKHPVEERLLDADRAQGTAIWYAVDYALNKSPRLQFLRDFVSLEGFDDGGSPQEAERLARTLIRRPEVLAIIGHTTSSTTRAGATQYARAAIPLLMPIATSPLAVYPEGYDSKPDHRFSNAFRLIPSDDFAQAPAVVYAIEHFIRATRLYVVRDDQPGTREYSRPLCSAIKRLLRQPAVSDAPYGPLADNAISVISAIRAQMPEVIVFCGYATSAKAFALALREEYERATPPERWPTLVLTDGAYGPGLNTAGFKTYVTFPKKDVLAYKDPRRRKITSYYYR